MNMVLSSVGRPLRGSIQGCCAAFPSSRTWQRRSGSTEIDIDIDIDIEPELRISGFLWVRVRRPARLKTRVGCGEAVERSA
ncbi:hypothetical protein [Rhodanobacter spathiphylli]|nr:hypothetical protein [Rhodanobacter spathiphylli]